MDTLEKIVERKSVGYNAAITLSETWSWNEMCNLLNVEQPISVKIEQSVTKWAFWAGFCDWLVDNKP